MHHLASLGWCCTFRSMMCKSNMFLEKDIPVSDTLSRISSCHAWWSHTRAWCINDLSEGTVQTVKDLLHKCKDSGQDPHQAMLCLCSTPLSHDLPSPAELLNGRVYQTNLPAVSKPSVSADGDINVKLQLRQDKQKARYDKTALQPRPSLIPEDCVRVFNPPSGTWMPGIAKHVADTPHS